MAHGTLYVISTAIGSLADFSDNAIKRLKDVDLILVEDTRRFGLVKKRFGIETPLLSYHEQNEAERCQAAIKHLTQGENLGLTTDAGTPCVSDPGYRLVRACRENNISVRSVPGPSAVTAALSVSGLPSDRFTFFGFVPNKQGARMALCEEMLSLPHTAIFFESPHRVQKTIKLISELASLRQLCVCRELSKKFEEGIWGSAKEVAEVLDRKTSIKGEFAVVLEGAQAYDKRLKR